MTIGKKLRKSRNDKGMSLRELATKVELSASFLSQIEQGKASPSIENLKKIAHTLDVRVAYLIEDEEDDIRNIEHIKKENIRYIESLDSNIKMGILLSNNREKNMEPIIYEIGIDGEAFPCSICDKKLADSSTFVASSLKDIPLSFLLFFNFSPIVISLYRTFLL